MYERNKKKRLSERYVLNKIGGDNMEKTCFVIMPFSKTTDNHDERYWTDFFEMLKTIMEDNGYLCIRSEVGPYKLFLNIVTHIQKSDIVIAVLTDFNSNVWYELGIRHTLKTGTIMLLQEGQTPSFDIRDFGIIFYKETPKLKEQLQKKIEEYLSKMSVDVNDSPVISAINNRAFNGIEKKLEEMEKLIWGLVNESSPRHEQKQYDSREIVHKILWVDDYPANNEGIMTLLESKNIHCDIAISTSFSFISSFGKLPITSDKPPALENGETSAAAYNIFIILYSYSLFLICDIRIIERNRAKIKRVKTQAGFRMQKIWDCSFRSGYFLYNS